MNNTTEQLQEALDLILGVRVSLERLYAKATIDAESGLKEACGRIGEVAHAIRKSQARLSDPDEKL